MHYVVLDPACGSGNFLYVAYRELRRIEADLRRRARDIAEAPACEQAELALFFPLTNMRGHRNRPVRSSAGPRDALDGSQARGR